MFSVDCLRAENFQGMLLGTGKKPKPSGDLIVVWPSCASPAPPHCDCRGSTKSYLFIVFYLQAIVSDF